MGDNTNCEPLTPKETGFRTHSYNFFGVDMVLLCTSDKKVLSVTLMVTCTFAQIVPEVSFEEDVSTFPVEFHHEELPPFIRKKLHKEMKVKLETKERNSKEASKKKELKN